MKFTYENDKYFDIVLDIAYEKYCTEVAYHLFLKPATKKRFSEFLKEKFAKSKCLSAIENDKCIGFILFSINNTTLQLFEK